MNIIPISLARSTLPEIIDQASTLAKRTYISVRGRAKAVIISTEELESLEATLEVLNDSETMKAIKQGQADIKKGRLVNWENIKTNIGS
jgi:antitoxin YefM